MKNISQTSESTISIVEYKSLIWYIEQLKHYGIIDDTDDYELIAECVSGNFNVLVEYEDIKEYYELEEKEKLEDEEMKLIYKNFTS